MDDEDLKAADKLKKIIVSYYKHLPAELHYWTLLKILASTDTINGQGTIYFEEEKEEEENHLKGHDHEPKILHHLPRFDSSGHPNKLFCNC